MTEDKSHEPLTYEHLEKLNKMLEENNSIPAFTLLDVILFGDIEEYPIDELNLSQPYSELDTEQRLRAQIAVTVKHFLGIV